jgi:hypothetical protein
VASGASAAGKFRSQRTQDEAWEAHGASHGASHLPLHAFDSGASIFHHRAPRLRAAHFTVSRSGSQRPGSKQPLVGARACRHGPTVAGRSYSAASCAFSKHGVLCARYAPERHLVPSPVSLNSLLACFLHRWATPPSDAMHVLIASSHRFRLLTRCYGAADPVLLLTVVSAGVVGAAVASVATVTYLYLTTATSRREPELLFSNSPFNEMVGLHTPFITGGRGGKRSPGPPHSDAGSLSGRRASAGAASVPVAEAAVPSRRGHDQSARGDNSVRMVSLQATGATQTVSVLWCCWAYAQMSVTRHALHHRWQVNYYREVMIASDNGAVALDYTLEGGVRNQFSDALPDDAPVLILLPGLTGGSQDSYVKHMVLAARDVGFRPVVFNSRRCDAQM